MITQEEAIKIANQSLTLILDNLLKQCTEDQRTMFNKIYPDGPNDDQLENAIDLCKRTIRKNKEGR